MFKLYFYDSHKEIKKAIAMCNNNEDIMQQIYKFVEEANKRNGGNFKIYYTRAWTEGKETWYDVGSWSEFFISEEIKD